MKVAYTDTAHKQLIKIPKKKKVKVLKSIKILKKNPRVGKKLKGDLKGLRSFKVWPYRIVYLFKTSKRLIIINAIEHRQQAYK